MQRDGRAHFGFQPIFDHQDSDASDVLPVTQSGIALHFRPVDLNIELSALRQRVVDRMQEVLPGEEVAPTRLHAAMRHGALVPGKCFRSGLVYASGKALGIEAARLDRLACAVELIHAYSLVHDDLPCMDDDDVRRGQPSCHVVYGEAAAVLAGNALLLKAIEEVAGDEGLSWQQRSAAVLRLCWASGSEGMIGGQQKDLDLMTAAAATLEELDEIHRSKTGCLIHASVMLPTELLEGGEDQKSALDAYGQEIGLAFQIRDDLDDMQEDGAPDSGGPCTYPMLLGADESRRRLAEVGARALAALEAFGDEAGLLRELTRRTLREPE